MIHFNFKNRPAFTMIELTMVIIVLGILASLAMPRLDRDTSQEAADNILSAIRYTQHLAVNDDMHEHNNTNWQQKYWHIVFKECSAGSGDFHYMIGADKNKDNANNAEFAQNEAATDPINGKPMHYSCIGAKTAVSENIFLTDKYGINAITSAGGCNGIKNAVGNVPHIGFDHLGRPHYGFSMSTSPNYASYMNATCTFTFTLSDGGGFSIEIAPETGYAHIVTQNDS